MREVSDMSSRHESTTLFGQVMVEQPMNDESSSRRSKRVPEEGESGASIAAHCEP